MIDNGGASVMWADRVRVSRGVLGRMIDNGGASVMWADRVRVSRGRPESA